MNDDILLVEKRDRVAILSFNRPEKKNALSPDLLIQICQTLEEFSKQDIIRTVIFRGHGDVSFCSGYDISALPARASEEVMKVMKTQNPYDLTLNMIKNFKYPTIAMLNGYAFGGGFGLAIACDIRIAADDIRMGMPPAKLGVVYHHDGVKQFIGAVGLGRTREIFLTARTYKGEELLISGIVDWLIPRDELENFVYDYAQDISGNAPLSLSGMKRIINMFEDNIALNETQGKEAESLVKEAFQSDDLKEGQTAFLEKRKPNFTGR